MHDQDRGANMLGALALGVADRLHDESEAVVGHSGAAAAALMAIAQYPGGTIEGLRHAVGLSHPAAVRVVDRLAESKLVERRAAERGPAVALFATRRGRERARRLLEVRGRLLADLVSGLTRAESRAVSVALEKMLVRLAGDPDRAAMICRLCDAGQCRRFDCPVARTQQELGAPPPVASELGPEHRSEHRARHRTDRDRDRRDPGE